MKKHLIITLSIITIHAHAMETENNTNAIVPIYLKPCHTDILNCMAQYLPFHDYELKEEFIERTRALTTRQLPEECFIDFSKKYSAYSPNNIIVAASQKENFPKYDLVQHEEPSRPQICIVDRKTNQKKMYKNIIGDFHQKLAVSNDGNIVATIYVDYNLDPELNLDVTYLPSDPNDQSNNGSYYNIPSNFELCDEHPTIAFNKQGTDIIVHSQDGQYIIFPLRLDDENFDRPKPTTNFLKTFAKYCAQRGICKNLLAQINSK